jgi:hypothetical protein
MMNEHLGCELVDRLLLPLMRGGDVRLLPPIGGRRARECSTMACSPDQEQQVRRFKLAAARRLYPLDDLGVISPSEWLLLCALNDALQLTHPDLSRSGQRSRLSELAGEVILRAGAPRTIFDVLSRHALFSRLPSLVRQDQLVTWWTGSKQFVGRRPPRRLLSWRTLRRVRVSRKTVRVVSLSAEPFDALLDDWLAATPLTHLLGAALAPRFAWCSTALGLVSQHAGRQLALRAIVAGENPHAVHTTLDSAAPDGDENAAEVARAFASELGERLAQV